MKKSLWVRTGLKLLSGFVVSLGVSMAAAQTGPSHMEVTKMEISTVVRQDYSSTTEYYFERLAMSQEGAQTVGKFPVFYNAGTQKYEVLDAYTQKADGTNIQVKPDQIVTQSGLAGQTYSASWPEAKIIQITFPDVQKGDSTVARLRATTHITQLPNWFNLSEYMPAVTNYKAVSVRLEAPKSLDIAVHTKDLKLTKSEEGDKQAWLAKGAIKAWPNSNIVNSLNHTPHFLASSIHEYEDLAASYAQQNLAKVVVKSELQKIVDDLVAGKQSDLEKTDSILAWIQKNIRYVAVYLGTGGFVAHDIDWILDKRYGDCKDHVLLLQAMLKAAHIEAVPALIHTGLEYELAPLPVGASFNHVIAYLPKLDMYIDPTSNYLGAGLGLPWANANKPVAVGLGLTAEKVAGRLLQTPAFDWERENKTTNAHWQIDQYGQARAKFTVDMQGSAALWLRSYLAGIPDAMRRQSVERLLASTKWVGGGSFSYKPFDRVQTKQDVAFEFTVKNFLNNLDAGAIEANPRLDLPNVYFLNSVDYFQYDKKPFGSNWMPANRVEHFTVEFDSKFEIIAIPKNALIEFKDVRYEGTYRQEGNKVIGARRLVEKRSNHYMSSAEYLEVRPHYLEIVKNLKSQILYRSK